MLHAFSHKKSRLYQRYLGHRDENSEKRVASEDEITSLIMGPLALFSPSVIGAFWLGLVRLRNPEHVFPATMPTSAEMHFWPRRGRIEPDLRVDLAWGSDTRILLVEFKWRAPLSGREQLHDQWRSYLSEEERAKGIHLLMGLDMSEGINALNRGDIWKGRLLMRSWFDVLTTLTTLQNAPGLELQRWGEQVKHTLALLAVRPFEGFQTLPRPYLSQSSIPIFFSHDLVQMNGAQCNE
jgi:hypothetical protein